MTPSSAVSVRHGGDSVVEASESKYKVRCKQTNTPGHWTLLYGKGKKKKLSCIVWYNDLARGWAVSSGEGGTITNAYPKLADIKTAWGIWAEQAYHGQTSPAVLAPPSPAPRDVSATGEVSGLKRSGPPSVKRPAPPPVVRAPVIMKPPPPPPAKTRKKHGSDFPIDIDLNERFMNMLLGLAAYCHNNPDAIFPGLAKEIENITTFVTVARGERFLQLTGEDDAA